MGCYKTRLFVRVRQERLKIRNQGIHWSGSIESLSTTRNAYIIFTDKSLLNFATSKDHWIRIFRRSQLIYYIMLFSQQFKIFEVQYLLYLPRYFALKKLRILTTRCASVICLVSQTLQQIFSYKTNIQVFVTETAYVFCAVRN